MLERSGKNKDAVRLGRRGGKIGGRRRAAVLSPSRRSAIARTAAAARWSAKEPPRIAERNSAKTKARIEETALAEFSRHGLAGARVEAIARRAGVNKRMIYHYFESKEGLFRHLMRGFSSQMMALAASPESGSTESSGAAWQAFIAGNPQWIRFLMLQSLNWDRRSRLSDEQRAFWSHAVEELRMGQKLGAVRDDVDAAQLQLSLVALVMFPFAMPQMTRLITGRWPDEPEFLAERAAALSVMLENLTTPAPSDERKRP